MYNVLYVDDEPTLLEIGKLFLEKEGVFAVDTFTSAKEALIRLETIQYDAIISDYQMPVMDGITFLRQLKASGDTTPFIIFTGRGREEVVIQALNEGADFYLQKGGEPKSQFAELANKIHHAVDRKQAVDAVRESEQRLSDITNFLPDATFAIDTGGRVIAWNRAIEEMTGVPARDMLGKGNYEYALPFYAERRPILIDLVSIPDDERTTGRYSNIKREGNIIIAETSLPRPMGRYSVLMGKASVLYNSKGNVIGAIESIRDITEKKQAEEALAESEKRFRELSDLLPQIVFETDTNGNLVYANHIAFELFGYSEDEFRQGLNVMQMLAPGDRERGAADFRAMFEGEGRPVPAGEYLALRKEGSTFPISIYSSPVFVNNRITGLRGIIVDMTERKQAEEALRESEERFRKIFENSPIGMTLVKSDFRFFSVNPSLVSMTGYSEEELLNMSFQDITHPEHLAGDMEHIRELVAGTIPVYSTEKRYIRKDGSILWGLLRLTAIRDQQGTIRYIGAQIEDISGRKQAENAIRESEQKYRTVFETTGTATILIENDGTISLANSEFLRLSGYPRDEIENKKKWMEFVVKEDLDRMLAQHRLRRTDQKRALTHYEFRYMSRSGEIRDIYLTIDVIPGTAKSVASLLDITERKRAEENLITANREYTNLLSQIQDIYYRSDTDGNLIKASHSWATCLGYEDISQCLGRSIANDFYLNPKDRKPFLEEVYRNGKVTDYEVQLRRKDGTPVLVSTSSHLYYDTAGKIIGVEGTFRDISERKQHEEVVRQQNLMLSTLNNLQREFAELPSDKCVEELVVQKLSAMSGAVVTVFSTYDPQDQMLRATCMEFAPGILESIPGSREIVTRWLGKRPEDIQIPLSNEMYLDINRSIVGIKKTITEISYGSISPLIGASIQKL